MRSRGNEAHDGLMYANYKSNTRTNMFEKGTATINIRINNNTCICNGRAWLVWLGGYTSEVHGY